MTEPLSPEREAEIRNGRYTVRSNAAADIDIDDLLAELDRVRAELAAAAEDAAFLQRNTLPDLRRSVQWQKDGKERWRDRAEKAETELRDLKDAAVEAERQEIRDRLRAELQNTRRARRAHALLDKLNDYQDRWAAEDAAGRAE